MRRPPLYTNLYLVLLAVVPTIDAFAPSRVVVSRPASPQSEGVGVKSSRPKFSVPVGAIGQRTNPPPPSCRDEYMYGDRNLRIRPRARPPAVLLHAGRQEEEESLSTSFSTTIHSGRVLLRCLWAIVAYMAVGVVAFSRIFERWPVIDSLYFSVVTFTTVGYGDLFPTTELGRLFTTAYSFAGISIVGALLGYVGGSIVEAERAAIKKTRAAARAAMMELFDPKKKGRGSKDDLGGASARVSQAVEEADGSNSSNDKDSSSSSLPGLRVLQGIFSRIFALRKRSDGSRSLLRSAFDIFTDSYYIFVPFLALAFIMGKTEGWSGLTSIYYAMATATTVGYGDVAPTSPYMRLLSILFLPLAVVSLGEILGRIAGFFIRKESTRSEREFMDRRMTLDDLEAMDTDKDGEVDLFEFLTFMLGSMQKVDKQLMNDLKALFDQLDASGDGCLQKEDLVLLAMRKRDPWSLRG